MIRHIRYSLLLFMAASMIVSCQDNSIPSDMMGTEGITQGTVAYDTVPGMREPSGDTIGVAEAIRLCQQLPSGSTSSQSYYILGYVKEFTKYETSSSLNNKGVPYDKQFEEDFPTYGNRYPRLRDRVYEKKTIDCYRLMSFKKAKFENLDQLQEGDIIVICGQLQNYYGSAQVSEGYLVTSDNPASGYKPAPIVVLNETFAESMGNFTIDDKKAASAPVWQHAEAGHLLASAEINGVVEEAESWLVSPAMDLTTCKNGAQLTFSHYYRQADDRDGQLRVLITTDGNNWTALPVPDEMWNDGKKKRFTAVSLDITEYKSAATRIAFAYKSTATNAPSWAIQNLRVGEPEEE